MLMKIECFLSLASKIFVYWNYYYQPCFHDENGNIHGREYIHIVFSNSLITSERTLHIWVALILTQSTRGLVTPSPTARDWCDITTSLHVVFSDSIAINEEIPCLANWCQFSPRSSSFLPLFCLQCATPIFHAELMFEWGRSATLYRYSCNYSSLIMICSVSRPSLLAAKNELRRIIAKSAEGIKPLVAMALTDN